MDAGHRFAWEDNDLVRADNGQMWRSLSRKLGAIDTKRTKVLYGRLGFMGWSGYYVGKLAVKYENGTMTFTVGDKWPASYYLIVAE